MDSIVKLVKGEAFISKSLARMRYKYMAGVEKSEIDLELKWELMRLMGPETFE